MPGESLTRTFHPGPWVVLWVLLGGGCDFFQELESDPAAAKDTDTDATGEPTGDPDGDGACELALDDFCVDQDTVQSCSLESGEAQALDCPALCGVYTNFSCVAAGTGQHACWCVEPGKNKVLTCTELESCLSDCAYEDTLACADLCFGRTDALTIRKLGALVHCAESTCAEICLQDPQACAVCIDGARRQGEGGCSLPRAVCDDDRNPDEPWP